jgi:hypothetical protein
MTPLASTVPKAGPLGAVAEAAVLPPLRSTPPQRTWHEGDQWEALIESIVEGKSHNAASHITAIAPDGTRSAPAQGALEELELERWVTRFQVGLTMHGRWTMLVEVEPGQPKGVEVLTLYAAPKP